ncbi:MAG: hypothetical protein K2Q10_02895, partial [Rhodospirillales bacterium]|nr:hypothetical protein [Rhodospirillales bacterium]
TGGLKPQRIGHSLNPPLPVEATLALAGGWMQAWEQSQRDCCCRGMKHAEDKRDQPHGGTGRTTGKALLIDPAAAPLHTDSETTGTPTPRGAVKEAASYQAMPQDYTASYIHILPTRWVAASVVGMALLGVVAGVVSLPG